MKQIIVILLVLCCHIVQAQDKIRFTAQGREKNPNGFSGVEFTVSGENMQVQYLKKDKLMDPFEYFVDEYRTFRGMPIYFNNEGTIAFALSADKKLLFDFRLHPDRQLIEDVTVWGSDVEQAKRENQNLLGYRGLFIDAQSTSAFHSQNMNKIVFMGKDVSLGDINPNDQLTSFTLGKQLLYVRTFTDTSLANRVMLPLRKPEEKKMGIGKAILGTAVYILAGSDDDDERFHLNSSRPNYGFWYVLYLDGNAVDTLKSQVNEDKELPIFQNWTTWRENNLLDFDVFEELHNRNLLAIGTHKLKLETYVYMDELVFEDDKENTKFSAMVAEGEITMEVTNSSMFDLKVATSDAYTQYFKENMTNEMEDAKLIADATKKFTSKFNKDGTKYELRKVASTYDKVSIVKNEFGRPLRKEAPIFVLVKEKATNLCQVFVFNFVYEFDGVEYDPTGDLWNLGMLLNIGDGYGVEARYGEPFVVNCDEVK